MGRRVSTTFPITRSIICGWTPQHRVPQDRPVTVNCCTSAQAQFEHGETCRIGANPGGYVVTFCGNLEPRSANWLVEKMERAKGFEPSTSTLARLRSTRLSYARFNKREDLKGPSAECKCGFHAVFFGPSAANLVESTGLKRIRIQSLGRKILIIIPVVVIVIILAGRRADPVKNEPQHMHVPVI
jgi:hypothetical protein